MSTSGDPGSAGPNPPPDREASRPDTPSDARRDGERLVWRGVDPNGVSFNEGLRDGFRRVLSPRLWLEAVALPGMGMVVFVVLLAQVVGCLKMFDAGGPSALGLALFILPAALLGLAAGAYGRRNGALIVLLSVPVAVLCGLATEFSREVAVDVVLCAIPYAIGWLFGWAIRIRRAEGQPPPTAHGQLRH